MIIYKTGNLFKSECQVLVNTVNCMGVMGAGIAKQFKQKWPSMFNEYKLWCKNGLAKPGNLFWWVEMTDFFSKERGHVICCFPTKNDWQFPSKLEYIELGLQAFVDTYEYYHVVSIAFPKLGCTNGKLDWNDVKPLMEKYLKELPITVEIYI